MLCEATISATSLKPVSILQLTRTTPDNVALLAFMLGLLLRLEVNNSYYTLYAGHLRGHFPIKRQFCAGNTVIVTVSHSMRHIKKSSNPADNADITFAISYGYSEKCDFIYFIYALSTVVVAEWLRRQSRNLLGPARVGSNPADNADITFAISYGYLEMWYFNYFIYALCTVVVAEWLRRQTRNLLGSARLGSNPADNAELESRFHK
ncbi:unnamed protein product [Clavelina lepadiformis]|uniref:Uncharacterized protein n=1 Tax=Clavelina lepadiformis TaxID=159417 RepID=A0ABP0EWC5_CLALP